MNPGRRLIAATGELVKRTAAEPRRSLGIGLATVAIVLAAGYVGEIDGRGSLAPRTLELGLISYFGLDWRVVHVAMGLGASVLLVRAAKRGVRRTVAPLVAVGVALGWLGFVGGFTVAIAEGRGYRYTGTAQVAEGSTVIGSVRIDCYTVIGEAVTLYEITGWTNIGNAVAFDLLLRDQITGRVAPQWGVVDGVQVGDVHLGRSFLDYPGPSGDSFDHVEADRLAGQAAISSGTVRWTVTWTCDPATRTPVP